MKCPDCRFFEAGICHRYPEPRRVDQKHWCGEFHDASAEETTAVDQVVTAGLTRDEILPTKPSGWRRLLPKMD